MARKRVIPNFLYGTLGLVAVGTATYYAVRAIRKRNLEHGDDSMMSLRRSTRNLGRTIKDSATKVGKDTVRGFNDAGEALADVGKEFEKEFEADPAASYNRI